MNPRISNLSPLTVAMMIWARGQKIPLTLAAKLMAEGYDVQALEERHLA
jgi:hypothetical protein